MMRWLAEDPWMVVSALGLVAVVLLGILKIRQEGRWLVMALGVLGLAGLILLIERVWVTDAERVDATIQELAAAVRRSQPDRVLALVTPDLAVQHGSSVMGGAGATGESNPAWGLVESRLQETIFDFFNTGVFEVQVDPGGTTATAQVNVFLAGSIDYQGTRYNFATDASGTDWKLELRREGDHWRVSRIIVERLPRGWFIPGLSGSGDR